MNDKHHAEQILKLLETFTFGLTAREIADKLGIRYDSTAVRLAELKKENRLVFKKDANGNIIKKQGASPKSLSVIYQLSEPAANVADVVLDGRFIKRLVITFS